MGLLNNGRDFDMIKKRVMNMKVYEKKYYLACTIIAVLFLLVGLSITMKNIHSYQNSTVLKEIPCENIENLGIIEMDNCSVRASQKRDDLNIYELFSKIQEDFFPSPILFTLTLTFLSLFMPCAYLKKKKKTTREIEGREFAQNVYPYAYIPVVLIPLLFTMILFLCGFVSNDYRVMNETWNGNVLIYLLMYYLMFVIGTTIYSVIHINTSLICVKKIHSYLGASILTLIVLFIIEVATKYTSFPSFSNFFLVTTVKDQFAYLLIPTILAILSSLWLKIQNKKKMTL